MWHRIRFWTTQSPSLGLDRSSLEANMDATMIRLFVTRHLARVILRRSYVETQPGDSRDLESMAQSVGELLSVELRRTGQPLCSRR